MPARKRTKIGTMMAGKRTARSSEERDGALGAIVVVVPAVGVANSIVSGVAISIVSDSGKAVVIAMAVGGASAVYQRKTSSHETQQRTVL